MGALAFAVTLLELVPPMVRGVTGAMAAFEEGQAALKKMTAESRDPSPDEWAALNASIDLIMADLMTDDG